MHHDDGLFILQTRSSPLVAKESDACAGTRRKQNCAKRAQMKIHRGMIEMLAGQSSLRKKSTRKLVKRFAYPFRNGFWFWSDD